MILDLMQATLYTKIYDKCVLQPAKFEETSLPPSISVYILKDTNNFFVNRALIHRNDFVSINISLKNVIIPKNHSLINNQN